MQPVKIFVLEETVERRWNVDLCQNFCWLLKYGVTYKYEGEISELRSDVRVKPEYEYVNLSSHH